jgi:ligand-binding SRPBCC domain-containing protein
MPRFETAETVAAALSQVFDFFSRPANLLRVSPPELHFQLLSGPEQLHLGARVTLQGRRWGVSQRLVNEVTVWEPETRFVDEQREGPFRRWTHTHRLETISAGGTRIIDSIDYEPPGGLLGMVVTAAAIERDLKWLFEYRQKRLAELLRG